MIDRRSIRSRQLFHRKSLEADWDPWIWTINFSKFTISDLTKPRANSLRRSIIRLILSPGSTWCRGQCLISLPCWDLLRGAALPWMTISMVLGQRHIEPSTDQWPSCQARALQLDEFAHYAAHPDEVESIGDSTKLLRSVVADDVVKGRGLGCCWQSARAGFAPPMAGYRPRHYITTC